MRILFISTGLGTGGAETTLHRLLRALPDTAVTAVVSLTGEGPVGRQIKGLGVPVDALNLGATTSVLTAGRRLSRIVRAFQPDVIQGWMYHANLAAHWARRHSLPSVALAWGIRQSLAGARQEKLTTRAVIGLGAWLSPAADAIVYNAQRSAEDHETRGFDGTHRVIIPNGIDCEAFRPDPCKRSGLRRALGVGEDTLILGHVARYHPMKGHAVLLDALSLLRQRGLRVEVLMAGQGVEEDNPSLRARCRQLGLDDQVHLLGRRDDVADLWQAVDIGVSPSEWGEGFPTAVAEAMACGVPCLVTDVGDSALLIGNQDLVVPPGQPAALADTIAAVAGIGTDARHALGQRLRDRVETLYGVDLMARRFLALYESLIEERATRSGQQCAE